MNEPKYKKIFYNMNNNNNCCIKIILYICPFLSNYLNKYNIIDKEEIIESDIENNIINRFESDMDTPEYETDAGDESESDNKLDSKIISYQHKDSWELV